MVVLLVNIDVEVVVDVIVRLLKVVPTSKKQFFVIESNALNSNDQLTRFVEEV